jgi:hypothetical protein
MPYMELVAGDCNAPNALFLPFHLELSRPGTSRSSSRHPRELRLAPIAHSSEKAGGGGSIPSLATLFSSTYWHLFCHFTDSFAGLEA